MAHIGQVIDGKYEIVKLIGEGGMAWVYLAMDTKLNKQWAIKEIKPVADPAKRRIVRDSLVTEANMIKQLDHPALPRIVDLVNDGTTLFVVMDYIEGVTLSHVLKERGAQDQEDVVEWGKQLCDALDYLHTRKPPIIYRDMKPGNVMLKPDGTVKIVDFGIAREYREEHGENAAKRDDTTMLGTRGYAAPEQFGGMGQTDARTDVYCLGATLYHLVTGKSPAEEPYVIQPIRQVNPALSPGLEKVIATATQQDPARRYQSCAEMLYALEHYQTADDEHRGKLRRIWRRFLGVCIAAVVFLALGVGCLVGAELSRNADYDTQMDLAQKAAEQPEAVEHYLRAVEIRPERADAYIGMVDLFKSDESFTPDEEGQLLQAVSAHLPALQGNGDAYANVAFEIGRLYWYYYDYEDDAGDNRIARVTSAGRWMEDAATQEGFEHRQLAQVYAEISSFNEHVVARINEGDDAGLYAPYFEGLGQLVDMAATQENDVVLLESAALAQDALGTYARKFRADGIERSQMLELLDKAVEGARSVYPTTNKLDAEQGDIIAKTGEVRQAVNNAFVDARVAR